jgi:hypothetical protein
MGKTTETATASPVKLVRTTEFEVSNVMTMTLCDRSSTHF